MIYMIGTCAHWSLLFARVITLLANLPESKLDGATGSSLLFSLNIIVYEDLYVTT